MDEGLFDVVATRKDARAAEWAEDSRARRDGWRGWPDTGGTVVHSDDRCLMVVGDCVPILSALPDDFADICVTDPPYSERTHVNARSNRGTGSARRAVLFDAASLTDVRGWFGSVARVTRRWVIATVDYRHAVALEDDPPPGLRVLRFDSSP